jgi:hypothetical protein
MMTWRKKKIANVMDIMAVTASRAAIDFIPQEWTAEGELD